MRIDISDFIRKTTLIERRHHFALESYSRAAGNKMEAYAKKNYRWNPYRTHRARDGINSSVDWVNPTRLKLSLRSAADYGIYLEFVNFRHKGRLSIWWPTVQRFKPEILQGWANAINK